jgi:hypothetical protein
MQHCKNIMVTAYKIWGAAMLILLMRWVYQVCVEMGQGDTIYIWSFIVIDSVFQKFLGGMHIETHWHTEIKVIL